MTIKMRASEDTIQLFNTAAAGAGYLVVRTTIYCPDCPAQWYMHDYNPAQLRAVGRALEQHPDICRKNKATRLSADGHWVDWKRLETEPCQAGTDGCCVDHRIRIENQECATW